MNRAFTLRIFYFALMASLSSGVLANSSFYKELEDWHLNLTLPQGFKEVAVIPNGDMTYDAAFENGEKSIQVRYALRGISKDLLKKFKTQDQTNQSPTKFDFVTDPNLYQMETAAVLRNIVQTGRFDGPKFLPQDSVKREFGADSGLVFIGQGGLSKFGKGFKNVMGITLHRDDIGQAYIFILYNDQNEYQKIGMPIYYSLKFIKPLLSSPRSKADNTSDKISGSFQLVEGSCDLTDQELEHQRTRSLRFKFEDSKLFAEQVSGVCEINLVWKLKPTFDSKIEMGLVASHATGCEIPSGISNPGEVKYSIGPTGILRWRSDEKNRCTAFRPVNESELE